MEREDELLEICSELDGGILQLMRPLIEQLVFLENQLSYLRTLPFIVVKEDDNKKQKPTPVYTIKVQTKGQYIASNGFLLCLSKTLSFAFFG